MNNLYLYITIILSTLIQSPYADDNKYLLPFEKLSKFYECKEKILGFIRNNRTEFRVPDLILLDFIQRRFNLPEEFSFENSYTRQLNPTQEDIAYLQVYGRMVEFKGIEYKKPLKAEPFVWNEIEAILTNKREDCPEKHEILRRLKKQLANGKDYEITHTALALGLFMERKCLDRNDPEVADFFQEVCKSLLHLSNNIIAPTDLKLESLCFLCYLNCKNRVILSELEKLLEYQRPDGAFSGSSNPNSGVNVHTTLLALWLLCEFTSPTISSHATMIRNP